MIAPTRDEVRFLLGELPQCQGIEGFGCGTREQARPAVVHVGSLGRSVCAGCAEVLDEENVAESPIASLVRAWTKEMEAAT